jgi:hypothetical protein
MTCCSWRDVGILNRCQEHMPRTGGNFDSRLQNPPFLLISPVTWQKTGNCVYHQTIQQFLSPGLAVCELLQLPLGRLPNLVEIDFAASRLLAWRLCDDPFNGGADLNFFSLGCDKCSIRPVDSYIWIIHPTIYSYHRKRIVSFVISILMSVALEVWGAQPLSPSNFCFEIQLNQCRAMVCTDVRSSKTFRRADSFEFSVLLLRTGCSGTVYKNSYLGSEVPTGFYF